MIAAKQIHIKLSDDIHTKLKVQAALQGMSIQNYVVEAITSKISDDNISKSTADHEAEREGNHG